MTEASAAATRSYTRAPENGRRQLVPGTRLVPTVIAEVLTGLLAVVASISFAVLD